MGGLEQVLAARTIEGKRLLRPHVLARGNGLQRDLHVGGRDGEVDDDLDVVIRQQFLDGAEAGNAELLGLRRAPAPCRCRR